MKRQLLNTMLFSVVMGTSAVAAFAQDGTSGRSKRSNVVIPARKIQFEMVTEPYAMSLPWVDPELLEQKYIVEVRLKPVSAAETWRPTFGSDTALGRLCYYDGGVSLFGPSLMDISWEPARAYFEALIANVPTQERPPEDILNYFLQHTANPFLSFVRRERRSTDGIRRTLAVDGGKHTQDYSSFFMLAPTEERAKELSQGLLTLFDQGLSRFGQEAALQSRAESEAQLRDAQQELEQVQETFQDRTKALQAASAIDAKAVADFVIRQHLLDVDLAGIHARVDAANKILAQPDRLDPTRIEQVESLKIAAEIDLAGLVARKKALTSLISADRARVAIEQELAKATEKRKAIQAFLLRCREMILRYDKDFQALAPFELVDGRVLIRPLRWESAQK